MCGVSVLSEKESLQSSCNTLNGVGLIVRVVGLGSRLAVELIPGGVDSACQPEVSKMSTRLLVSCVRVATHPGLCPIAKETAEAAPKLCTEYGPNLLIFTPKRSTIDRILALRVLTERR